MLYLGLVPKCSRSPRGRFRNPSHLNRSIQKGSSLLVSIKGGILTFNVHQKQLTAQQGVDHPTSALDNESKGPPQSYLRIRQGTPYWDLLQRLHLFPEAALAPLHLTKAPTQLFRL